MIIYIHTSIYIYIYIYIERERERERKRFVTIIIVRSGINNLCSNHHEAVYVSVHANALRKGIHTSLLLSTFAV